MKKSAGGDLGGASRERGRDSSADARPSATSASPRRSWFDIPEEERDAICREDAFREAREQGLPEQLEDPVVYAQLARILFRDVPAALKNRKAA